LTGLVVQRKQGRESVAGVALRRLSTVGPRVSRGYTFLITAVLQAGEIE